MRVSSPILSGEKTAWQPSDKVMPYNLTAHPTVKSVIDARSRATIWATPDLLISLRMCIESKV